MVILSIIHLSMSWCQVVGWHHCHVLSSTYSACDHSLNLRNPLAAVNASLWPAPRNCYRVVDPLIPSLINRITTALSSTCLCLCHALNPSIEPAEDQSVDATHSSATLKWRDRIINSPVGHFATAIGRWLWLIARILCINLTEPW
jgi:hypothetical protein